MANTYLDRADAAEPGVTCIQCAAIRYHTGDVYWLPKPARHHDVIHYMVSAVGLPKPIKSSETQGFLTNKNEFVDRRQAAQIALAAGQVKNVSDMRGCPPILFSEDVW